MKNTQVRKNAVGKTTRSENPFYGLKNLFALEQNKAKTITTTMLDAAWREAVASGDEAKRLFHVINFSTGDISNRNHNIFGIETAEKGGNSNNANWITYLKWLLKNDQEQFNMFLPLMVQYVNLRDLVTSQVKTQKGKKTITGTSGLLQEIMATPKVYNSLLTLLQCMWNDVNPMSKYLVAKFVKTPDYSRSRTLKNGEKTVRPMQTVTLLKMKALEKLCTDFSNLMGWEIQDYGSNKRFTGYINARKPYIGEAEYVLFSNKTILDFDSEQFLKWLNKLPSSARFQTRRRLMDGDNNTKGKWVNKNGQDLAELFLNWEKSKEKAQEVVRVLEEKQRTVGLNIEENEKLAKVKKVAKVTVGASTLFDHLESFLTGKTDDITIQSIIDLMEFDVPVLPVVDNSVSMGGRPIEIAKLLTTLLLYKNSTKENLFFRFGSHTEAICDLVTATGGNTNRFMKSKSIQVTNLVDRTKTVKINYNVISNLVNASMGSTNISGLAETLRDWTIEFDNLKEQRIEQILNYPVILLISDGDLNNSSTQAASLNDFMMKMKQWFGWNGVVVLWDIPKGGREINKSGYFDNIENVIHLTTWNLSTINQIFTKINDIDVIDIYTALKSLYMSNRYELVKMATL